MLRSPREVAVFVHRDDRFLLTHRVAPDGYWHVVAGQVEAGEDYQQAAARELREETGLADVALLNLHLRQVRPMTDAFRSSYPADTTELIIENFAAEGPYGWEPHLNDEHDAHQWCSLEDALGLLHWPEARSAIVAASEQAAQRRREG